MFRFARLSYGKVRVRYAPSPTGMLHLGNLRTALYNYLFAQNKGGEFILRIQDTDQKRKVPGALENIYQTLKWMGIEVDEGPNNPKQCQPYIQSERSHIYRQYLERLSSQGVVYKCFCQLKERTKKNKDEPYHEEDENCQCCNLGQQVIDSYLKEGRKYAIKLRASKNPISFDDAVYKRLTFPASSIKDFVIMKNDGFPTYHFANVVDDISMKVTHVFRGEEWITSTPKHIQLYKLFNHPNPVFAHLPTIQNKDRKKLSKRDKSTSVEHYISNYYLPEAIINSIALLGWTPKNMQNPTQTQIYNLDELIKGFRIEDIHNYPAMFDPIQLQFFNNHYMKQKYLVGGQNDKSRINNFKSFMKKDLSAYSNQQLFAMSDIIIGRIKSHSDIVKYNYLYQQLEGWDKQGQQYGKQDYTEITKVGTKEQFEKSVNKLLDLFSKCNSLKDIDLSNLSNQQFHVLRFCLTGKPDGPNAIQICKALGLKETLGRITRYLK